jgi:hypothetical protein
MTARVRFESALVILVAGFTLVSLQNRTGAQQNGVRIDVLSGDPALVTGGDALVGVVLPESVDPKSVRVTAGTRDVTSVFAGRPGTHKLAGVITGLSTGTTSVSVRTRLGGAPDASLTITNYPITGPVFSGPHIKPFICQTDAFTLPDGTKLGAPLDENCSARTVVHYVYRSTNPPPPEAGRGRGRGSAAAAFTPLPSLTSLPTDVAKTTTMAGQTVNFVVRVETGTMNRGIYQNAILHDPTSDPPPTPATPPKGWNGRLIGVHGSGCPGGWYVQGAAMGVSPLDLTRLGEGYAVFVNSLNHPTNSCNAVVAAEAAMMGKEHFIETFGVPLFTISTGGSGGAYTSLQIADAFPGMFDGVSISATFPDALSIALAGLDAHLLTRYFTVTDPAGFTDAQKLAITGYQSMRAFIDAANQSQRTDPVPDRQDVEGYRSARWNDAVPAALRYHPTTNPRGARPTVFDVARNIYGINPRTGAALRPFDNVGVQYGLNALNSGAITPKQFIELNDKIGGFDQDANYVPARSIGDAGAIKRTYQSGLLLSGSGGLSAIPIFDNATSNEEGGYHYGWFHFALRERVRQANGGNSDNMVMWRSTSAAAAKALFDEWVATYRRDAVATPPASKAAQRALVIQRKPATGLDGCYDRSTPPKFVGDSLPFTSKPASPCSSLYPVYSNTRHEAGGPLAANVLKCQLKPIDARDYQVAFKPDELARLKAVFPGGVCDWSKPGVNQTPVVPWASYGPSPKNLIFDVTKP